LISLALAFLSPAKPSVSSNGHENDREMRPSSDLQTPRSDAAPVRKIGLVDHIGFGNLGDDATQVAVMKHIRNRWPNAEIVLFSMNPADSCFRHGVAAYPIRAEFGNRSEGNGISAVPTQSKLKDTLRRVPLIYRLLQTLKTLTIRVPLRIFEELSFLRASFRIVKPFDLLIISGGGQLLDSWGGPWRFPYTVFKWTLLAKLARAKCYILNVGAGPLDAPLAKWFVKSALGLADYVSFRDSDSRDLVQKLGFAGKSQVSADCVYALGLSTALETNGARQREPLVGLSPMAYCDPRVYWKKDQVVYERYIRHVASFGRWLSQNDYRLTLFSTEISFDSHAMEEVKALLDNANGNLRHMVNREDVAGIEELLSTMGPMEYVVTSRFHGVVFAHLLNKPVLALSSHPKVSSLMNDLGLAKYCLDIRTCDVNTMQETFLSLVANRDEIKSRMAEKAACYERTLLTQFDQLFPQGKVAMPSVRSRANEHRR
jgi:polysaccharide pyruvyl transferase WcaK-like protein